jgi:hypothetical protein
MHVLIKQPYQHFVPLVNLSCITNSAKVILLKRPSSLSGSLISFSLTVYEVLTQTKKERHISVSPSNFGGEAARSVLSE